MTSKLHNPNAGMIDLGEILEEINVPDLSCPLALQSNTDNPKEKDLFAEQKRHAWDKSDRKSVV